MERWKIINAGLDWVNSKENGKEFISDRGKRVYKSGKKLQKLSLESGDINKWDLTLMASVLQAIRASNTEEQSNDFKKLISSQNKNIERLSAIRNHCAHSPTMSLTDEEFNELWDEMALILISFGDSEEELEVLKREQIIIRNVPDNEKEEQNEIRAKATELKKIGKYFLYFKRIF
jgi:hypothetical protein